MQYVNLAIFIVLIAFSITMIISTLSLSKRNKMNKKLIECVDVFDNDEVFLEKINTFVNTINNKEYETKGLILKMWHGIINEHKENMNDLLDELNFKSLVYSKGKVSKTTMQLNEDSFYYYNLAAPNCLYAQNDLDMLNNLRDRFMVVKEEMDDQLVYALSEAIYLFYTNKDDKGEMFLTEFLNGNYSGYRYSKQMVGIYKDVANVVLAKIYFDRNDDKVKNLMGDLIRFKDTKMGRRFMTELKIYDLIPNKDEVAIEETNKEETK